MRFYILIIALLFVNCSKNPGNANLPELRVTGNESIGYGYEIWENGKCRIRQENLPALSGNIRCPSQSCAEKIGQLALNKKMLEGQFPPTLKPKSGII
ncbi:MAG: DUF4907 domain-containing protein [Bacteroidia bacterium]